MSEGSAAIGRTVRAGLAGWAPGMRSCGAALVVGALLSLAPRVLPSGLALLGPLIGLAAVVLASGAVYRALFAGPSGWRGLRWGREEWRLSAVALLTLVIFAMVSAVLLIVIGAVTIGVARGAAPAFDNGSLEAWRAALSGPAALPASLAPLLSLALLVWLFLRLSLAPAATIDVGRIQVLSAFGRTRGAVPRLLAAGFVLVAPVAILVVALGYAQAVGGFPANALVLDLIGAALLFFYLIPVWSAALAEVYRHHAPPVRPLGTPSP